MQWATEHESSTTTARIGAHLYEDKPEVAQPSRPILCAAPQPGRIGSDVEILGMTGGRASAPASATRVGTVRQSTGHTPRVTSSPDGRLPLTTRNAPDRSRGRCLSRLSESNRRPIHYE